tara:strand:- start:553 stop:759 length:207 start_codon:yes stop_codon:yes gene_type:complete
MTQQEQKGLVENVVNLLEGIHDNTPTKADPQKSLVEVLAKQYNENRITRIRLKYAIDKLKELKLNLNK